MFLETLRTEGLAAFSYIVGDGGEAAVIDPQRDFGRYIEVAHQHDARITHVFETHRNEDFVVGSRDLAERTGAIIHHGAHLDFAYGKPVHEGNEFQFGAVRLKVLETPGHTDESLSLAIYDNNTSRADAIGVFSGDALFVGDVGRTDLYPGRQSQMAGLLYDSIHKKLLPLGNQVVLYPAHGAGSVCGSQMADRDISTLGYERRHNPRLQLGRDDFIKYKVREHHDQPPYFLEMEAANKQGRRLDTWPHARPCSADAFATAMDNGMVALDVRSAEGACGAHIPGSLCIPTDLLSGFAGWYLPHDADMGLIADSEAEVDAAVHQLVRMGYERIRMSLPGGLHAWVMSGRRFASFAAIHIAELQRRMLASEPFTLLDVRNQDEWEQERMPAATHIYVGDLGARLDEMPDERPLTTLCSSGQRALIAASVLARNGFEEVEVCLGSLAACHAIGCTVERGPASIAENVLR